MGSKVSFFHPVQTLLFLVSVPLENIPKLTLEIGYNIKPIMFDLSSELLPLNLLLDPH
ncbi:MAG: hypothetical protein IJT36_08695 [Alphaproteobacteria bacterium]|nr:hypothetical protein [Alphaproteobacteria bacterium]